MTSNWMGALALLAAVAGSQGLAESGPAAMPGWMAGSWLQQEGENWVAESWTPPRGGAMLGNGLTGKGDKAVFFEFFRLEADKDGVLTYWASPRGAPATPFRLVSMDPASIVFANPAHDYPQRIAYRRTGKTMTAEISLMDGGKAERWTYRLVGGAR